MTKGRGGWQAAAGGLVTALRPALEARPGSKWVGWDGGGGNLPRRVEGLDVEVRPVRLSRAEVDGFYHGFSNRTLWPLLHELVEQPAFDRAWWRAYVGATAQFAACASESEVPQDALLWLHDYHLMLLPMALRRALPGRPIGFFLHVPFPPPALFARLPWRRRLLDGLLGADVVAFHTEEYRDNFVRTCIRIVDGARSSGRTLVLPDGRRVETAAHPISIDAADFAERARRPGVERRLAALRRQFAGRRVLVGVDRLDYTKGIVERLRAIELLLEHRPDLRERIALVQVAVPSRGEVREYRTLRSLVEETVGRINGRFTQPGRDVPIHYLHRSVSSDRLLAYYRLADVALVTPLRDGMNLVAKEFAVTQAAGGESGVLVLSEFTGAAAQLREALICNPFDLEDVAGMISLALELPDDDRRRRVAALGARVAKYDVHAWAAAELGALEAVGQSVSKARLRPSASKSRKSA